MRVLRLTPAAYLVLLACNPFGGKPAVEVDPKNARLRTLWNASLATPSSLAGAVQMKGSATMGPAGGGEGTRVTISLSNATPGGSHPWEIHQGQCGGTDGGIVGSGSDYEPLEVDGDGRARGTAEISAEVPTSGNYFVAVHAASTNRETVVACGNFAPPLEQTGSTDGT